MTATLFIITGPRGAGKTTFCRHFIDLARQAGRQVAGIVCPAVFENGQKVAIEAEALATGLRLRLATAREPDQPKTNVSTRRWFFEAKVLAWGNRMLQQAVPCEVLIVDELGPLEFEQGQGWTAGLKAIDSGEYRWGLVVIRPELLAPARQRWPTAKTISITEPAASRPLAAGLADRLFGP